MSTMHTHSRAYALGILMLLALFSAGCATARNSPPVAQQQHVAQEVQDLTHGDKKAAAAEHVAVTEEVRIQQDGRLGWLAVAGVIIAALGLAMVYEHAGKLGWSVVIVGGGMVVGGPIAQWCNDHANLLIAIGCGFGAIAAIWHYRKGLKGLVAREHGTEHLVSAGVQKLIARVRSTGPSLVTKFLSLLHVHAKAAIPTPPPKAPGA